MLLKIQQTVTDQTPVIRRLQAHPGRNQNDSEGFGQLEESSGWSIQGFCRKYDKWPLHLEPTALCLQSILTHQHSVAHKDTVQVAQLLKQQRMLGQL